MRQAGRSLEGGGVASGGLRELIPTIARTAVAVGVDGLFMEVHDDPTTSPVDSPTQWPLRNFRCGLLRCCPSQTKRSDVHLVAATRSNRYIAVASSPIVCDASCPDCLHQVRMKLLQGAAGGAGSHRRRDQGTARVCD